MAARCGRPARDRRARRSPRNQARPSPASRRVRSQARSGSCRCGCRRARGQWCGHGQTAARAALASPAMTDSSTMAPIPSPSRPPRRPTIEGRGHRAEDAGTAGTDRDDPAGGGGQPCHREPDDGSGCGRDRYHGGGDPLREPRTEPVASACDQPGVSPPPAAIRETAAAAMRTQPLATGPDRPDQAAERRDLDGQHERRSRRRQPVRADGSLRARSAAAASRAASASAVSARPSRCSRPGDERDEPRPPRSHRATVRRAARPGPRAALRPTSPTNPPTSAERGSAGPVGQRASTPTGIAGEQRARRHGRSA